MPVLMPELSGELTRAGDLFPTLFPIIGAGPSPSLSQGEVRREGDSYKNQKRRSKMAHPSSTRNSRQHP